MNATTPYEVEVGGDVFVTCRPCADVFLARIPGASAHPEPAAPRTCDLQYDGCTFVDNDDNEGKGNR